MKREHLIIIAVVIFILVGFGCAVLGAIVLWPSDPKVLEETTTRTWSPPELPPKAEVPEAPKANGTPGTPGKPSDPQVPIYTQPRVEGQSPTPSRSQNIVDYMPGVYQCIQASPLFKYASAIQFNQSADGWSGLAYFADDPYSNKEWIELKWELGVEGYLSMFETRVPSGYVPTTYRYWLQYPTTDMNILLIYSAAAGDEALAPAVFQRVQ